MIKWRFPSNDHGENKGINDSGVATFRGTPLKSLAREICQNSLDAGLGLPVHIELSIFEMPVADIPGASVLEDAFGRCLEFWKEQKAISTKEFFDNARKVIARDTCTVLRISDFNTVGLTGTKASLNTNWTNLTKSSGASDKKGTAGGSYGIGKYAPFACSDFSVVFYSTLNEDGEEAYQGVARLVTFERAEDGETTQGIGYFGEEKNKPVEEQLTLDKSFERKDDEFGTDIYIVGYKYCGTDWKKNIIVSILDSFLGAIWTSKLSVDVGGITVSKESLGDIIEVYKDDLTACTKEYYQVLVSPDTRWIEQDFLGMGQVKLGLLIGEKEAARRICMIRKTGMKIMDKDRLPGHIPCNGVMFIEGEKLNEQLRLMENPEHTQWQPERARNPVQAKELLRALNRFIKEEIEKLVFVGNAEEVDAAGVGAFLPDDQDTNNNTAKQETVSDTVMEIEKEVAAPHKENRVSEKESGSQNYSEELDGSSEMEPEGNEDEWFHHGGNKKGAQQRHGEDAHQVEEAGDKGSSFVNVMIQKFIPVCVDKAKGEYVLIVTPAVNAKNGKLEVYLSAETQNYKADIIEARVIGGPEVIIRENIIAGINYTAGKPLRVKLKIDYYDLCAMEVKAYATEE